MSKVEGNGASNWEAVKGAGEGIKAGAQKIVESATSPLKTGLKIADEAAIGLKEGTAKIFDGVFGVDDDIIKKITLDPKQLVDDVISPPKGTTQTRALLDFEEKLSDLSDKELSQVKGYAEGLLKNEKNPENREILTELLTSVAQEEKSRFFKPNFKPEFPVYPPIWQANDIINYASKK